MDYKIVTSRLKDARIAAGFTQSQLASRLKTSEQFVKDYESATQDISLSIFLEICQILGVCSIELMK